MNPVYMNTSFLLIIFLSINLKYGLVAQKIEYLQHSLIEQYD